MNRNQLLLIFGVVFIGFIVRFIHLSSFPAALHRDEAFLGYNAYSILKTGKDMTGDFLPLHFKSFLYSPGGYSYFSMPFISIFGLNEFSIRAASAFFGSLGVGVLFFLTSELLRKKKQNFRISISAAVLLAFLPWHINLSRTATENVIVVFFLALGTLLYLLWARLGKMYLFFGAFMSMVITLFLYQAPRSFLPFYIPLLILLFAPRKRKAIIISALFYLLLIIVPVLLILLSPNLALRIKTVSIFSTDQTQLVINEQITQEAVQGVSPLVSRVFHNKALGYSDTFIQNYFDHFSFSFLFTDSALPDRYRVPLSGIIYIIMLPLIVIGSYFSFKKYRNVFIFLGGTVLLVPIGSALAFDDIPNLQRTLFMAPLLCILSAIGLYELLVQFENRKLRLGVGMVLLSLFAFSVIFYLRQYYIHQPVYRPWFRNDGYRDLVRVVNERKQDYEKVVITNRESAPTIFFLVYSQYDPELFQEETKNITTHDFDRVSFGDYTFVTDECPIGEKIEDGKRLILGEKRTLYINSSLCNTIEGTEILDIIKRKDGSDVFYVTVLK